MKVIRKDVAEICKTDSCIYKRTFSFIHYGQVDEELVDLTWWILRDGFFYPLAEHSEEAVLIEELYQKEKE